MKEVTVFELAQQNDIGILELMDKIRDWKIPVRNHMQTLDSEIATLIRKKIGEEFARNNNTEDEKSFSDSFDKEYEAKNPNFSETLNIALIGKVSSGKSSLLNAILERPQNSKIAKVSAEAGTTVNIRPLKFGDVDNVLIIDSPGLDDVNSINSEATKKFLKNIDVGIFVVHGAADASQTKLYNDLKASAKKTFVALNKIDEYDDKNDTALKTVKDQWEKCLNVSTIYSVCAKGYDDNLKAGFPLDIRGVDELRTDILQFLTTQGKDLHLKKHLKKKEAYIFKIIATALIAVAIQAFIPGSAAYITATQAIAIGSIYYVMTGTIISKSTILMLLPRFFAQSAGTTLFLWAKSILPPTGVVDVAAAGIAVTITFAMLATVYQLLKNGYSLADTEKLASQYNFFKKAGTHLKDFFKNLKLSDLKNPEKILPKIIEVIRQILENKSSTQ